MPNHFQGEFVAKGDTENITHLQQDLEENSGSYAHNIFPVPEDYEIKDDIRVALRTCDVAKQSDYWGSKWGFYDFEKSIHRTNSNTLVINFTSAWRMPDNLFKMMAKKYNLQIRACGYETGCGFMTFMDTNEDRVEDYTIPVMMLCDLKQLVEEFGVVLEEDHREYYEKNKNKKWASCKETENHIFHKDEVNSHPDICGALDAYSCAEEDEEEEYLREMLWHYFDDFWNLILVERGVREYYKNPFNKDKRRK